jgi:D-lactate dehydrogenase
MGRIGQRVATVAHAFDMRVLAYDVDARAEVAESLKFEFVSLDDLLVGSDVLSLHTSLSPATHHILNRTTLAKCRPGVIIINTARGRLIDTHALREALESGQVGAAGLDVLEDERVMRQPAAGIIASEIIEHLHSDVPPNEARSPGRLRALQNLMLGDALLARSNVVFTPHTAFNSDEAVKRLQQGALENVVAFIAGAPVNLVE